MSLIQRFKTAASAIGIATVMTAASCSAPVPAFAQPSSAVYCWNASNLAMFLYENLLKGATVEQADAYLQSILQMSSLDDNLKRISRHLLYVVAANKDVVSAPQLKQILLEECKKAYNQEVRSY